MQLPTTTTPTAAPTAGTPRTATATVPAALASPPPAAPAPAPSRTFLDEDDRVPLVAARRRASVLATLGCLLLIVSMASIIVGRDGGGVTLVSPQQGTSGPAGTATGEPDEIASVRCGEHHPGQLRYEVVFADGTTAVRVAAPVGRTVVVHHDASSGAPLPAALRFSVGAQGAWSCSVLAD